MSALQARFAEPEPNMPGETVPHLSVVVVVFNMAREAPRTLLSLSPAYQRDIAAADYEIIVVDNGSEPPFDPAILAPLGGNFRLIRMHPAFPSPAAAVNRGLTEARGDIIGVMIDGARIVTPGLLHFASTGARLYPRSVVAALTWHLGFDMQSAALEAGYDRAEEDALLTSIGWPADGYRLFDVATLAGSSTDGWFLPISESNALFLSRASWEMLGGYDERFDRPGGGLVNLDTYRRAVELPGAEVVLLLGEGTFHQVHGGVATNARRSSFGKTWSEWAGEYKAIRGTDWAEPRPRHEPTYLGRLPRNVLSRFVRSALEPARAKLDGAEPPLGRSFDRELWAMVPPLVPSDPLVAKLVALAHREMRAGRYEACAAVARVARRHAPEEPELRRLLALVGPTLPGDGPPADREAFEQALREAYDLLAALGPNK